MLTKQYIYFTNKNKKLISEADELPEFILFDVNRNKCLFYFIFLYLIVWSVRQLKIKI